MSRILTGFLFIFLDFNLTLGNSKIGLIPDFIGYLIMLGGLAEMAEESPLFENVRPFAVGMAVYTGILYAMDLIGLSASLGFLTYLIAVIGTVVSLYISYNIVTGVQETEVKRGAFLAGDRLRSCWVNLAILNAVTYVSIIFPFLAVICIIVTFIIAVIFLLAFRNSKNLYYEMKARPMGIMREPEDNI